jgi:signal transduction histidine kinase
MPQATPQQLRRAVARAGSGKALSLDETEALLWARGDDLERLMAVASGLRDLGHGRTVTYSRKVFIPLTMLCRDHCHYCTFAKPPAKLDHPFLTPDEVVAVAEAGRKMGCKEALFTLGDRPEERYDVARRWLDERGFGSTLEYVRAVAIRVIEETGLLPHLNPGVMSYEEMARLNRMSSMGELTASLAHELNQPLTAIASNAAAGRRFLAQGPPETKVFEELLADVAADARRAGDIIHGIHHFVRKGEGTRRPINLNEIVREVLRLLHSDLLGRGTAVETELAPSLPAVDANPVQLEQVLLNLLMNSLEAMQSTSAARRRIVISTTCEANSSVTVSVRDYGNGLPTDDVDKVFSHFYSTKPNGMGMGLTIVRSIVEAHGGKLNAENSDEGARFFFRLPIVAKSETEEVA